MNKKIEILSGLVYSANLGGFKVMLTVTDVISINDFNDINKPTVIDITDDNIDNIIRSLEIVIDNRHKTYSEIDNVVSNAFNIHPEELKKKSREPKYVMARALCVYIMAMDYGSNYLGELFKLIPTLYNRDRSTGYNMISSIEKKINTDNTFRDKVNLILRKLNKQPIKISTKKIIKYR